ncbi:hypothetical protein JZO76_06950 [Enterococcus sp. MJM12]|uniref:Uncharacterized protein n=1 Tax=Candidatus Enterococcus myersii TaxID=2815322 RepID=A0ABS3H737_9ENTE|nr:MULTISPECIES: hypothetical protein [Enterococcus]MBO0449276.1 hypothetical protein [Enterococcus sp. MJM12]MCD1025254.1 hypothetical protein [Enterococcus sp. SMC-9]WHA09571.1 hypothetical protein P3T75_01635 [Enterococcus montenegrensis]
MGLWDFFRQKKTEEAQPISPSAVEKQPTSPWQEVPAYIETDPKNYELVSVIASAIMAGEQSDSQFVVKRILERNPEAKLVSIISASIAAGEQEDSQLTVKKIMKK